MLTTLKVLTGGVITMYNFDRELETLTLNIKIKIKMFSFIRSLVYAEMETGLILKKSNVGGIRACSFKAIFVC